MLTYQIGDIVERRAFENHDGRWIPHAPGLTVIDVKIVSGTIPDYQRITAAGTCGTFEGPARFFVC